jgi:hypothetical protein
VDAARPLLAHVKEISESAPNPPSVPMILADRVSLSYGELLSYAQETSRNGGAGDLAGP